MPPHEDVGNLARRAPDPNHSIGSATSGARVVIGMRTSITVRRSSSVTVRNANFQRWETLLTNRTKRNKTREFLVHGVRPITLAVDLGWPLRAILRPLGKALSQWADDLVRRANQKSDEGCQIISVAPELLRELGERSDESVPELIAVAEIPPDELDRIPLAEKSSAEGSATGKKSAGNPLVVVFDRPGNPGNIGTVVRSADAFGASGVIITGHAADPYDPQAVRAGTGSHFAVPIVRVGSPHDVVTWARSHGLAILGTDETGTADLFSADLTVPAMLVIGNETRGMSTTWKDACDEILRIPIGGAASSLNAAAAASIFLYEARRQRGV